jgi:hypothetical protein
MLIALPLAPQVFHSRCNKRKRKMMKLLKEKERNSKRKSKRKKKRKIKRKRQKKRKRKQEKEKKKVAFGKGLPFFSWLQDQLWKSLLQLLTLRTNRLK